MIIFNFIEFYLILHKVDRDYFFQFISKKNKLTSCASLHLIHLKCILIHLDINQHPNALGYMDARDINWIFYRCRVYYQQEIQQISGSSRLLDFWSTSWQLLGLLEVLLEVPEVQKCSRSPEVLQKSRSSKNLLNFLLIILVHLDVNLHPDALRCMNVQDVKWFFHWCMPVSGCSICIHSLSR